MFGVYIGIIIFSSLMLIILGLLQHSKKENSSGSVLESSNFGQFVGIKKTGDILENLTLFFIFLVFYLSILSYRDLTSERRRNLAITHMNNNDIEDENINNIETSKDNEKTTDKREDGGKNLDNKETVDKKEDNKDVK